MHRPLNFHIILELDPSIHDWSTIENRISEKRRIWSREQSMGSPAKRRKAELYLSKIDEMVKTLKDPATRAEVTKEARKILALRKQEREKELEEQVAILEARGCCTRKQVRKLITSFEGVFSENEIENRIKRSGIKTEDDSPPDNSKNDDVYIDPVTARSIQGNLGILDISNLYELLDLPPQSSAKMLRCRADDLNKELLNIGKFDAESGAKKALYGICLKLFLDNGGKEKYDNSYAVEAMHQLNSQLNLAGEDSKLITEKEFSILIRHARQKGVDAEDAKKYILSYAQKRNWHILETEETESERMNQCGFCGTLADNDSETHCRNCGEPFIISCPRCSQEQPGRNAACSHCGFLVGDYPVIKALLEQGEAFEAKGDLDKALNCFNEGLYYWRDWALLCDAKTRVERILVDYEKSIQRAEGLFKEERRLLAAQDELARFEHLGNSHKRSELKKHISDGLSKANKLFKDSSFLSGEEAFEKYTSVLNICADHKEARQAVTSCPPPAPDGLIVHSLNTGFRLTWNPANAAGSIRYRVCAGTKDFPSGRRDGHVLEETANTCINHCNPGTGVIWYYAVYSVRMGVTSKRSALSGPHMTIADIDSLTAVAGDGEVTFEWIKPKEVKQVEVWRRIGPGPAQRGKDVQVPASGNTARDFPLTNGKTYSYLIVSIFQHPSLKDKEQVSEGIRRNLVPVSPPEAVMDLCYRHEGKEIVLNYTPISGASVQIRKSGKLPAYPVGKLVSVDQLHEFGTLLPNSSKGSARVDAVSQQRHWFLPLTVVSGTVTVGKAISVTLIDPVTDLKSRANASAILLTWTWPENIKDVLVCVSTDTYPASDQDKDIVVHRVTKESYDACGFWEMRAQSKQTHYFTVFAISSHKKTLSEGISVMTPLGRLTRVNYRVVPNRAVFSRKLLSAELEVSNKNQSILDHLVLRGKKGQVPVSRGDGILIRRIPQLSLVKGKSRIAIPGRYLNKGIYVKLFFENPGNIEDIRLLPSRKEQLKLG